MNQIMEVFTVNESFKRSKDFVNSPFRYPGGKFYALKFILPFLNAVPHEEYREPFVGGGSVFFGKKSSPFNWINDLDSDLINTYKVISNDESREILISKVCNEVANKTRHAEIKSMIPKSLLEIAFRTYYLNRTSYSGIINKPAWGYRLGKSSPPPNWEKFLINASTKLKDINITNLDFEEVILKPSKGRRVLLYLDPPYFHADQKRAYIKSFSYQDHKRLREVLKKTTFHFCLSYDDCSEVREMYQWANIFEKKWFYNTANTNLKRKLGNELLITNFDIKFIK